MSLFSSFIFQEAVAQTCSVKKAFLEISQNSQENTCAKASFLMKLQAPPATSLKKRLWHRCEFCEISKNTFFHRTSLVAASVFHQKPFSLESMQVGYTAQPFNTLFNPKFYFWMLFQTISKFGNHRVHFLLKPATHVNMTSRMKNICPQNLLNLVSIEREFYAD